MGDCKWEERNKKLRQERAARSTDPAPTTGAAELRQRIAIALDRTVKTAISLGQAEEREYQRLLHATRPDGKVRQLREALEFNAHHARLLELLAAALAATPPAPAEVAKCYSCGRQLFTYCSVCDHGRR